MLSNGEFPLAVIRSWKISRKHHEFYIRNSSYNSIVALLFYEEKLLFEYTKSNFKAITKGDMTDHKLLINLLNYVSRICGIERESDSFQV